MYRNRILFASLAASFALVGAGCSRPASVATEIKSFEECVAAGNPVMESQPRQCRANGATFFESAQPSVKPTDAGGETPTKLPDDAPSQVYLGEKFSLIPGQSRMLKGTGIRVTLGDINDSRCPAGVKCIWEGELSARLTIDIPATKAPTRLMTLGTVRNTAATEYGYRFELKDATEKSVWLVVTK